MISGGAAGFLLLEQMRREREEREQRDADARKMNEVAATRSNPLGYTSTVPTQSYVSGRP